MKQLNHKAQFITYRSLALTVFTCLLFCVNVDAQSSPSITEQQVLDVVNSIDRAARRKNVARMIAPLAEEVKIRLTVTIPKSTEPKHLTLTKEQYAYQTKMAFRIRFKYTLLRKNIKVKIYDDGLTALVSSELYETFSISNVTIRGATSEVAYLIKRDGKLLFTSIESNSSVY